MPDDAIKTMPERAGFPINLLLHGNFGRMSSFPLSNHPTSSFLFTAPADSRHSLGQILALDSLLLLQSI